MGKKMAGALLVTSLLGGAGVSAVITTPTAAFATADDTARSPGQWVTDALKGLVDKGTITQDQSNAVAAALQDARPEGRFGGPGGPGGRGPGGHHGDRMDLAEVAETLGVSEEDLKESLATKSLADIAKEKNVDIQKVIDVLVSDENARIDQGVTDGRLTQAQAEERKAKVTERVTNMVNNVRPQGRPHNNAPEAPTS